VCPSAHNRARVDDAGAPVAVSEHTNATEAEFAARERAEGLGADRVVVHDRYHRTRDALAWPVGLRARAVHTHPPSRRDR
jgi:hypothetical protein